MRLWRISRPLPCRSFYGDSNLGERPSGVAVADFKHGIVKCAYFM